MAIKYGEFEFKREHGYTGSAGKRQVRGYMRGGYAEGGMRSESTEEAKATRRVQDDAFAPAKQLNKSLKNLNRVRKETGYGLDDEAQNFAKGGFKPIKEKPNQPSFEGIGPGSLREQMELYGSKPLRPNAEQKSSSGLFAPLEPDLFEPKDTKSSDHKRGGKIQFARGGLRKVRSDKGMTKTQSTTVNSPGPSSLPKMPGNLPAVGPADLQNQTDLPSPGLASVAGMRMGGRTKRK